MTHFNTKAMNKLNPLVFQFQDFDVKALVKDHPRGLIIEGEYKKNSTLTPETRILLVNIVTSGLIKKYG